MKKLHLKYKLNDILLKDMITMSEIKKAVDHLPEKEYVRFRTWFTEHDWEKWDKQIEEDSQSGALDFLLSEAKFEKKQNSLRPM
jgi:hypothetical protein